MSGKEDEYDPGEASAPGREPPQRSTAPQSEYTTGQVTTGLLVMIVGVALIAGLTLALA